MPPLIKSTAMLECILYLRTAECDATQVSEIYILYA